MHDCSKFRAIRIVYLKWLMPSQKIRFKALKKIQRFWRKASGYYAEPYMTEQSVTPDFVRLPSLYRQVNCCSKDCPCLPVRKLKKIQRAKYCLVKLTEDHKESFKQSLWNKVTDSDKNQFLFENCWCNKLPKSVYKAWVERPRYRNTSTQGVISIICALSGDELTYNTRMWLSNFIVNRLR